MTKISSNSSSPLDIIFKFSSFLGIFRFERSALSMIQSPLWKRKIKDMSIFVIWIFVMEKPLDLTLEKHSMAQRILSSSTGYMSFKHPVESLFEKRFLHIKPNRALDFNHFPSNGNRPFGNTQRYHKAVQTVCYLMLIQY